MKANRNDIDTSNDKNERKENMINKDPKDDDT